MRKVKKAIIGAALVMIVVFCGCGETYTCSRCGKEVHKAYYDPLSANRYYCEDCAKEYFAPLPYANFEVGK